MYDLIITNGRVASEHDVLPLDVAVLDEKIVALGMHGQFDAVGAKKVIDAGGKYVVPGGVDPHVHFDLAVSEVMVAQAPTAGSRAGLWGGTTTYIDFSLAMGDDDLVESVGSKLESTRSQRPHADYALHAIVSGDWPLRTAEQMREVINGGVVSFKFFTTFQGTETVGGLMSDDGRIYSAMLETEKHGGITMVHCEDECIIDYHVRKLTSEGKTHFSHIHEARPTLAEEAAVRRMLHLSRRTGSPLYIVHVSAAESVEAIAEGRAAGIPVAAEALHSNLRFDPADYLLPEGQRYMNYPPNRPIEHREELWAALADGRLDTLASDDYTVKLGKKLTGATIDNLAGGTNSIETRMAYFWSEGVTKRDLSVSRFVELTAAAPARLFGIYGRKGVIRPGADADLVVFDPDRRHTWTEDNLHSDCDYSNWEGWEVHGFPVTTVLRGHVMVHEGEWVGPEGIGQFIPGGTPEL
ncbi:amidohydrolase family protein [Homoserinibacter sp. GY 40078]|uniref:amidohydrolase family protein n=1 Tax=Homoserinibacter sp. GY 40078 TaxID=2603275 RepID=UPI0011CB7462|nr:amidohydrolase family protein [Homoserinibacter sp. GY 40078]TXK19097.1 amidohydrolase family protein [Homoserinibacter sp. GY 40078]